ncbi:MAG: hypothetical protein JXM70_15200 [Pirellulales bacterium]|nr:hypothetical protein [Pirellulales bacterium]
MARSSQRRQKERAIRRRQTHGLRDALRRLQRRVREGWLKGLNKIVESVGRLKERYPQGAKLIDIQVSKDRKMIEDLGPPGQERWLDDAHPQT